jgi:prephenate dehydrogenase
MNKTKVMESCLRANDAGRSVMRCLQLHGYKTRYFGGERRAQTAEEKAEAIAAAVRWARAYADRADIACRAVEAWAVEQGVNVSRV